MTLYVLWLYICLGAPLETDCEWVPHQLPYETKESCEATKAMLRFDNEVVKAECREVKKPV